MYIGCKSEVSGTGKDMLSSRNNRNGKGLRRYRRSYLRSVQAGACMMSSSPDETSSVHWVNYLIDGCKG